MSSSMGEIIKRLRKERGMTQEQLAQLLNLSAQSISKWENNSSMPDVSQIVPLATVLKVKTDVLFGMESCNNDEEVERIIRSARSFLKRPLTREGFIRQYDALQKGLERYPNHTRLLMESLEAGIALSYPENFIYDAAHAKERYEECIRQANIVISYSTNTTDVLRAHMILVLLHAANGNAKQALLHAEKFPVRADMNLHLMQAYCAHWKQDYRMEVACYQYGFLYSFHAILNLLVHLFKTYTILERYPEAKEMLEFARRLIDQLLENETTLPPLHYLEGGDLNLLLAKACLRLGDREEALSHLERMTEYDLGHAAAFRGDAVAKSPLLCNVKWGTFFSIPSDRPQRLRAKLTDADLEPLQDHPRFQRLMDRVKQAISQKEKGF